VQVGGWEDLTPEQRRAIVAVGVVTTIWQAVMLIDLARRPAEQVRGSKRAWVLASFVRPVGQIAYYAWGRRPPAASMLVPDDRGQPPTSPNGTAANVT
jgi:hypothetical protein